ncbi:MAG: 4Fe-4S binding protein [Bacteroides sp.]|nr:4Fe-4S binding protein [Prevotella sp.]MCM1407991.1 4Fe-4S binding protein [Treponema brennaborense]MCM1468967.1 4Fe-4S binding protein [Bacteroides sp.]
MNFLYPIYTAETECQDCYKCIRQCPVKAIRVENGHAMIIPELCIACGRCVINCPAKAKHVRDDLGRTKQLLTLKKRVIASVAPSFVSEFNDFTPSQFSAALKQLGFWGISETAIGADLVSKMLAEKLAEAEQNGSRQKLFLSSACPAVVEYIKQFQPEFSPYITDCASPLLAHARYLKNTYGSDIGIVFIGPCIAKKREADIWKTIDVALTFDDMRRWFSEADISPATVHADSADSCFIPQRAAKGSLYPIDGGMIAAFKKYNKTENVRAMAAAGIDEIPNILKNLDNDKLTSPLFIELLACPGGCINGPGSARNNSAAVKRVQIISYAETAEDTLKLSETEQMPDLTGTLPVQAVPAASHTPEEIRTALRLVGKFTPADELNCASCGYDTCRAFAEAMLDNRAEKTMCVSYMRKLAQKKANGLIQAIPGGVVIADKNLQIVECNRHFAELLGSDITEMYDAKPGMEGADLTKLAAFTHLFSDALAMNGPDVIEKEVHEGKKIFHVSIFAIEKEEIAGCVIEDITAPQVRKNRTISQAKKVINKNLSVVQKIAFLLGENAAETESILNSIIESFSAGEETEE